MFSVFYIVFEIKMFIFDNINKNYKWKSQFFKRSQADNFITTTILCGEVSTRSSVLDTGAVSRRQLWFESHHVFEYVMVEGKLFNMY